MNGRPRRIRHASATSRHARHHAPRHRELRATRSSSSTRLSLKSWRALREPHQPCSPDIHFLSASWPSLAAIMTGALHKRTGGLHAERGLSRRQVPTVGLEPKDAFERPEHMAAR